MSGYSAESLIKDWWPDHVGCLTAYGPGRKVDGEGVVCGCGTVLGWPHQSSEFGAQPSRAEGFDGPTGDGAQGSQPDPWANVEPVNTDLPPWDINGTDTPDANAVPQDPAANAIDALVPAVATMPSSAVVPTDPIESRLVAIDPTRVYTATDIELQLVSIEARLEQGQLLQRVWEVRALQAEITYTLAYAQAISASDASSADRRKAEATIKCKAELEAKLTAQTMAKAVADTMHNLRSMLSGYQSIAKSVSASMSVGGMDLDRAREDYARYGR